VSTKENMDNLVKVGQELLEKPASRVDPETGKFKPIPNLGTNADALKRFVLYAWYLASFICHYISALQLSRLAK